MPICCLTAIADFYQHMRDSRWWHATAWHSEKFKFCLFSRSPARVCTHAHGPARESQHLCLMMLFSSQINDGDAPHSHRCSRIRGCACNRALFLGIMRHGHGKSMMRIAHAYYAALPFWEDRDGHDTLIRERLFSTRKISMHERFWRSSS